MLRDLADSKAGVSGPGWRDVPRAREGDDTSGDRPYERGCEGVEVFFDFNLASDAPGWANPRVQIRDVVLEMTASDFTDALGELLQALMLLVNGSSRASCEWTQEPGGWRWDLRRPDEAFVDLVIAFKDDAYSEPWMFIESAQVRLEERVPLTDVIGAITSGSRRCLEEWGLSGFAKQWDEHPFPQLQLEALERWLSDSVAAPIYG